MDALGVDDAVLGRQTPLLVQFVDERSGGVHDGPRRRLELLAAVDVAQSRPPPVAVALGRHEFDVVGHARAGLDGRADEREHEAGVVVDQVRVVVLDRATDVVGLDDRLGRFDLVGRVDLRSFGTELPDPPIRRRAETGEPRRVRRRRPERGEEPDLFHVVGVRLHEAVPGSAEPEHERQLVVLEVLEAAPHQVGRLL